MRILNKVTMLGFSLSACLSQFALAKVVDYRRIDIIPVPNPPFPR